MWFLCLPAFLFVHERTANPLFITVLYNHWNWGLTPKYLLFCWSRYTLRIPWESVYGWTAPTARRLWTTSRRPLAPRCLPRACCCRQRRAAPEETSAQVGGPDERGSDSALWFPIRMFNYGGKSIYRLFQSILRSLFLKKKIVSNNSQ